MTWRGAAPGPRVALRPLFELRRVHSAGRVAPHGSRAGAQGRGAESSHASHPRGRGVGALSARRSQFALARHLRGHDAMSQRGGRWRGSRALPDQWRQRRLKRAGKAPLSSCSSRRASSHAGARSRPATAYLCHHGSPEMLTSASGTCAYSRAAQWLSEQHAPRSGRAGCVRAGPVRESHAPWTSGVAGTACVKLALPRLATFDVPEPGLLHGPDRPARNASARAVRQTRVTNICGAAAPSGSTLG